jgi:hypothetical protein
MVSFMVPRDRMPNLSLEYSTNLSQWDPSGIDPVITPVDADWNEWSYTFSPTPGWERAFFRMRVSQ